MGSLVKSCHLLLVCIGSHLIALVFTMDTDKLLLLGECSTSWSCSWVALVLIEDVLQSEILARLDRLFALLGAAAGGVWQVNNDL